MVGIAGPGEPLANEETFETFCLIKKVHPHLHHCISSNGLLVSERCQDLVELGVRNITITLNALHPEIAEKIYSSIVYHEKVFSGLEGAQILIEQQLSGIGEL